MHVPVPPFAVSTVVLPTLAVLGSGLIASALFTVALISQTGSYSASAARHIVDEKMQMADLSGGLLLRLSSRIPQPHHRYVHEHNVSKDTFDGELLVEEEPSVRADQSASGLIEAFRAAWQSPSQQPLLALGLFGLLLGVVGVVLAFVYARSSGNAMVGLVSLAFVASAQFAMASAHKLWNRVDFQSTLYRIRYVGTYHRGQRVAGNAYAGNGTLAEGAVRFGPTRVEVCVAQVTSVAFMHGGARHLTAVDLQHDASNAVIGVMQDYAREAQDCANQFYVQEHQVREVMNHGSRPPELPRTQHPMAET